MDTKHRGECAKIVCFQYRRLAKLPSCGGVNLPRAANICTGCPVIRIQHYSQHLNRTDNSCYKQTKRFCQSSHILVVLEAERIFSLVFIVIDFDKSWVSVEI